MYSFVALGLEAAANVCSILGLLCLLILGKGSHSLRRFLGTFVGITCIVGLVGGITAMVAAAPNIAGTIHLGDLDTEILRAMITGVRGRGKWSSVSWSWWDFEPALCGLFSGGG
ncbi:hypothetical protein [Lacticaseibacillus yichunensis]|uniref:Uncharacterized protein n=1 Tax=Lacticaseibacillus yichunensis TaxID=2486015 RepID=A0ABW4CNL3_9LACO|nr:hypothetical protein [Lacticaseibacillus yichunensis]